MEKIVGDDGSEVSGYGRYLEYKCRFSEPLLENALPDSCDCHLGEGGHFLLPP